MDEGFAVEINWTTEANVIVSCICSSILIPCLRPMAYWRIKHTTNKYGRDNDRIRMEISATLEIRILFI